MSMVGGGQEEMKYGVRMLQTVDVGWSFRWRVQVRAHTRSPTRHPARTRTRSITLPQPPTIISRCNRPLPSSPPFHPLQWGNPRRSCAASYLDVLRLLQTPRTADVAHADHDFMTISSRADLLSFQAEAGILLLLSSGREAGDAWFSSITIYNLRSEKGFQPSRYRLRPG